MKKHLYITAAALAMILSWTSCKQVEEEGSVSFGLELSDDTALKSTSVNHRIDAALVTIKDRSGALIYDKEYLPVYKFGDQFTTKSLKIPVGKFHPRCDSRRLSLWRQYESSFHIAHRSVQTGSR